MEPHIYLTYRNELERAFKQANEDLVIHYTRRTIDTWLELDSSPSSQVNWAQPGMQPADVIMPILRMQGLWADNLQSDDLAFLCLTEAANTPKDKRALIDGVIDVESITHHYLCKGDLNNIKRLQQTLGIKEFSINDLKTALESKNTELVDHIHSTIPKEKLAKHLPKLLKRTFERIATMGCTENIKKAFLFATEYNEDIPIHKGLAAAAKEGKLDAVKFLIDNGANPQASQSKAARNAARFGRLDCLKFLIPLSQEKIVNTDLFINAVKGGHQNCVEYLFPITDKDAVMRSASTMTDTSKGAKIRSVIESLVLADKTKKLGMQAKPQQGL